MKALKTIFIAAGLLFPIMGHAAGFDVSLYINAKIEAFREKALKVTGPITCLVIVSSDQSQNGGAKRQLTALTRERRPYVWQEDVQSDDDAEILAYLSDEFVRLEEYAIIHDLLKATHRVYDTSDAEGRAYRLIRIIDDYALKLKTPQAQNALKQFIDAVATDDVLAVMRSQTDLVLETRSTLALLKHSNRAMYDFVHDKVWPHRP